MRGSLENHLFIKRRPWSPDAQAPTAKDSSSLRPPPPAPSPIQHPRHPLAPPRSSAARALKLHRARRRGEELPAMSLSSAGKPAGGPGLLLASTQTHACRDVSPHSWAGVARTAAAMRHPFLGSYGVDAGGGGECKWISDGCVRW